MLDDQVIAGCFNAAFLLRESTRMCGGAAEPLYVPARDQRPAELHYREDFAASALHEAAHWCIAGRRRRALTDFGYTYLPPPRTQAEQDAFFAFELKTQALESIFADAAGVEFRPSADNLDADLEDFAQAIERIRADVERWCETTPDGRARRFVDALERARLSAGTTQGAAGSGRAGN